MSTDARPDLVEALLQSCWLLEAARAEVMGEWAGEFAEEAGQVRERTQLIERILDARGVRVPREILEAHAGWVRALCGLSPTDVPLGAAVLQRLGHWTEVYVKPYLGEEAEHFVSLEDAELRFPVPPRHMQRDEAFIREPHAPPGRRFVVLTDIHAGAQGVDELARTAVAEINELRPEFVVVPGDITDDGEPAQFAHVKDILDGLECPVHVVLGNHDAVQRSTRAPVGADLFAEAFGQKVEDRVLQCGPLQVALIDSTDPVPSPFPDWDLARGGFRDDAGGVNNGALTPEQIESLKASLDPSQPALLVLHHELQPFAGFPPVMFGVRTQDSDALLQALSSHRVVGVMAGHTHRSALTTVGTSVPQLEIPALKDWPYAYTLVTVDDEAAHVRVHQIRNRELVWARAEHVPPIYLNYVTSPLAALDHTFPLA